MKRIGRKIIEEPKPTKRCWSMTRSGGVSFGFRASTETEITPEEATAFLKVKKAEVA